MSEPEEEAPPFLERWSSVYALLLLELAALSVLFYALTRWAA